MNQSMQRILLCGALAAGASDFAAAQLLSDFTHVVYPDAPLPVQQAAAEELAHYAGRLAGHPLALTNAAAYRAEPGRLAFFVGAPAAATALGVDLGQWKQEEWMLKSVPQGLIVAGDDAPGNAWSAGTRAGTMLAAYTLLDDVLGVRWFWPGPFGEHVPTNSDARIPLLDRREKPAFSIRSLLMNYGSYHTAAYGEASRKWYRRNRLAWTRSAVFGHSWYDAFNLKTDQVFAEHPEWFALVNGKRRPPQMCTTHPEVIARMVEHVLAGKSDIMHISPSDGGGFCECERCQALDEPVEMLASGHRVISDRIFTYANEVARRVREKNPDRGCGMFAYTYYNSPPRRIAKLEPNLYLSFVYQAAAMRDPEHYAEWKQCIAGWQKLGAVMVAREGWGNHYALDLPYLHYEQIAANLSEAHRLGFIAAYGDGSKAFATQAPNTWAITRMLWDPTQDAGPMMAAFWRDAYGPVAAEMQGFFEAYSHALDRNWAARRKIMDATGVAYVNLVNSWHILLPTGTVNEAEACLAAAERKVPPGEYADRVAFHRLGQDYTRVLLGALDCYRRLAELGLTMEFFSTAVAAPRTDEAEKARLLKMAYALGEERERLLLAHRDWAALSEGLYAFANDRNIRQWHAAVKQALGIDKPSAITGATLK